MSGGKWWGSREVGPKPTYKVLQADLIKGSEKERAAAIASFVESNEDAYKLAGHEGFSYKELDIRGRCGVVMYKGMEVALLFKREVYCMEPGPADPVPERILREPKDAWIQISLLKTEDFEKEKGIGDRLRQAIAQIERLKALYNAAEADKLVAEDRLKKLDPVKKQLSEATQKNLLLEESIKRTNSEVESLKAEVSVQKEERKRDKRKMIEELFPAVNTLWLAGVHRINDQLYSILKKQMLDGLAKIGVVLIEPKVGEKFDPEEHHAVHAHEFEEGAREIGCITNVSKAGWKLGSIIVEAAEVVVGIEKRSAENENVAVAEEQQRGV